MALTLITGPENTPVTLEEAKAWCRIDHTDDDDLIQALLEAATAHLDGKNGTLHRCLEPQTWELAYDDFPDPNCNGDAFIEIPLPPLIEIVSIKYDDADGVEQTIDPANYSVDTKSVPGWVVPVSTFTWPTPLDAINAVRVRFRAGYEEVDSGISGVPTPIKTAIKVMVVDWYENRESVANQNVSKIDIPATAERMLNQYRIHEFA